LKKTILFLCTVFLLLGFIAIGPAQALFYVDNGPEGPFYGTAAGMPDVYTFYGGSIWLDPGEYYLTYSLSGYVYGADQWEGPEGDVIWTDVTVDGSNISHDRLEPQPATSGVNFYDFHAAFSFYLAEGGDLLIESWAQTTASDEYWGLNCEDSAILSGTHIPKVPEASTMLLLGFGLIGLGGFARRKFKK
jgi:hypothetical protein